MNAIKNLGIKWSRVNDLNKLSREEEVQAAELRRLAEGMEKESMHVAAMVKTPGWAVTEEFLDGQIEYLKDLLVRKDDVLVRAKVQVYKEFKNFVLSKSGNQDM